MSTANKTKVLITIDEEVADYLRMLSSEQKRPVGRILQELVIDHYADRPIKARRLPASLSA